MSDGLSDAWKAISINKNNSTISNLKYINFNGKTISEYMEFSKCIAGHLSNIDDLILDNYISADKDILKIVKEIHKKCELLI